MLPYQIDFGAESVQRRAFAVQHAIDAVPDIALENDGRSTAANPYISLQAATC